MKGVKIAIGSDHRGFHLKNFIKKEMEGEGIIFFDFGSGDEEICDYPDFAIKVSESVSKGESDYGILICLTGIGMSISANKVKGVRAALCKSVEDAYLARAHNDANILCIGSKEFRENPYEAIEIVKKFITTQFERGRHLRRIEKIREYENKNFSK
ncbi:MAG: ribose 5-phosphate isomerase B [candidate division WOR-3 bacterium]